MTHNQETIHSRQVKGGLGGLVPIISIYTVLIQHGQIGESSVADEVFRTGKFHNLTAATLGPVVPLEVLRHHPCNSCTKTFCCRISAGHEASLPRRLFSLTTSFPAGASHQNLPCLPQGVDALEFIVVPLCSELFSSYLFIIYLFTYFCVVLFVIIMNSLNVQINGRLCDIYKHAYIPYCPLLPSPLILKLSEELRAISVSFLWLGEGKINLGFNGCKTW